MYIDIKTLTLTVLREQSPGAAGARIVILSKHVNMITCDAGVGVGMFVVMRGVLLSSGIQVIQGVCV